MNFLKIISILTICLFLFSCSADYYLRKGDRLYRTGRYYKSCDSYKEAFSKLKSKDAKVNVAEKIGDVYGKINKLSDASIWYKKSLRYTDNDLDIVLKIIEIAHKRGDEKLIEKYLSNYESLKGVNSKVTNDNNSNIHNTNNSYKVEFFKKINSRSSDFSPVYKDRDTNMIYFTSTRRVNSNRKFFDKIFGRKGKIDGVSGLPFSNVYSIEYTDKLKYKDKKGRDKIRKLKKPKWVKSSKLCDTTINSRFNEGAVCFSPDGKIMFFTSSRKIENKHKGTKIYIARKTDENWGGVKLLNIVPDSVSVGHPAINPEGTVLFFVSDMDKGFGGKDIWYCKKTGEGWSEPINAGKSINTKGDEMFPYFRGNGDFYFSSNGHPGLGGLDIFKLVMDNDHQYVENIGYPLNSESDDFGIVFKHGVNEGLFSSSRGKKGVDNIYKFKYIGNVLKLRIKTIDELTGDIVSNVSVKVLSENGMDESLRTDKMGEVAIELKRDGKYLILVYKEGYLKDKIVLNNIEIEDYRTIEKNIFLKPIKKSIELPDILYDFGKWELKEDSKMALDKLVNILNNNPNIVIELSSHTDMIGSETDNALLSQKRAQYVVEYLIEKGIYWDRLFARGYGESVPKVVTFKDIIKYSFLERGKRLTKEYIDTLGEENRRFANQLNRRTEFRVLKTDYKPGPESRRRKINMDIVVGVEKLKMPHNSLLVKDIRKIKGVYFTLQLGKYDKDSIPEKYKVLKVVFYDTPKRKSLSIISHGIFDSFDQAKEYRQKLKEKGFDSIITAYKDGKKIDLKEGIKLAEKSN